MRWILTWSVVGLSSCGVTEPPVLPVMEPYVWEEYSFPDPSDGASCSGVANESASIGVVRFAQTHMMEPDWPFFFLLADRPARPTVPTAEVTARVATSPRLSTDRHEQGGA